MGIISHISEINRKSLKERIVLGSSEVLMIAKLGEIVASIYLVTKVNKKGLICEYLDITTGKRIVTSTGGLEQNKSNIRALSDKDLEVLAETMANEKYVIWKQGFQTFIKRLCKVVNSYTPDDQKFHPLFTENCYWVDGFKIPDESCDFLTLVYPDDLLAFKLPKEQIPVKYKHMKLKFL